MTNIIEPAFAAKDEEPKVNQSDWSEIIRTPRWVPEKKKARIRKNTLKFAMDKNHWLTEHFYLHLGGMLIL